MAKDIAALSAGDKLAFKAALGGMGYVVPLASGEFSADPYVDLALPTGYVAFNLMLINVDVLDNLGIFGAFSADGGSTFPQDLENNDSYYNDSNPAAAASAFATLIYSDATPFTGQFMIDPGRTGKNAVIQGIASMQASNIGHRLTSSIYNEATGRQNVLRLISPYALSATDNNGRTLDGGYYYLSGIPTPA